LRHRNFIAEFGEPFEQAICRFFGFDLVLIGDAGFALQRIILYY